MIVPRANVVRAPQSASVAVGPEAENPGERAGATRGEESLAQELAATRAHLGALIEQLEEENAGLLRRDLETRHANDDLTNVLSSVGIAIVLLDRELRVRRFTPEAGRLLRLTRADLGRRLSDLESPLHAPDLLATVREVLESLVPRDETVTDDAGHGYKLAVRAYQAQDGKIDGTVLSLVNIDGILRSRALLTEAHEHAESIVDTVQVPLVVLEDSRRVRSANRAFYEAFGLTREQVAGERFDDLGDPSWSTPTLRAALARLTLGEAIDGVRLELSVPLRGERTVVLSGRPMARAAGRPRRFLLALEDLTEAMKSEALVRRSEKSLRDMLAAASEAILIVRQDGTVTFANPMAVRTFGYAQEEFLGLSVDALVPDARRAGHPSLRAAFTAAAWGPQVVIEREVSARRKDGSVFPLQLTLSTMEGDDGPLAVAFVADITERKQHAVRATKHKQALQDMAFDAVLVEERERRRIAAGLHDNVGQALALAQLHLHTARSAEADRPHREFEEGLRLIARAIEDTRSLTFELSPPILYDLGLAAAVSWLGEQLGKRKRLKVSVTSDDALPTLDHDVAALLFRSIRELLSNVVKHANTNTAAVALLRDGQDLLVRVRDEGAGFDPSRARDWDASGGFGLFSVREQLMRLGGIFEVDSRPARGTSVTLRLPLQIAQSKLPAREPD